MFSDLEIASAKVHPHFVEPRAASPTFLEDLVSKFSWANNDSERSDYRVPTKRRRTKGQLSKAASEPRPFKVARTTPKPSVVFFPTNEDNGCGEASAIGRNEHAFYLYLVHTLGFGYLDTPRVFSTKTQHFTPMFLKSVIENTPFS